jgi:hypothetical protein
LLVLAACGSAPPAVRVAPVVHVEPVASVAVAGPKCVAPIDEPPPKWQGTYPKLFARVAGQAATDEQKALVARNPDVEGFFFDERGLLYGFITPKLPYPAEQITIPFLTGRNVLADSRTILEELRCHNPDVAHFEPTWASIGHTSHSVTTFQRKQTFDDLVRDEPLPAPLADDVLLSKWNLGIEVARIHRTVVHHPAQRCVGSSSHPCDPIGPSDETIETRVPVGTLKIPKKYLKVTVTRGAYRRAPAFELRLIARVEVRWPELQSEIITPRFGSTLEPQVTGNLQEIFDAVTGESFNP